MHHWITTWNVRFLQVTSLMTRNLTPLRWGSNLHIFHSSYLIMMSNKMGSHADYKGFNGWPLLKETFSSILNCVDGLLVQYVQHFVGLETVLAKRHNCHVGACVVVRVFMTICNDTPSHMRLLCQIFDPF